MKQFLLSLGLFSLGILPAFATEPPQQVTGVTVKEREATVITLKWTEQDAVDKYQVRVTNSKGELVKKVATTKIKLKITDLKPEKKYTFKVRSKISDQFGEYSQAVTAKTKAEPEEEPVEEVEEEDEDADEEETAPVEDTAQTHLVAIDDFAFNDASITIAVGDTVQWINQDSSGHTVTEAKGSFNSGTLTQSEVFEHTFTTAGSFSYFCALHSSMTGTVVVQ